MPEMILLALAGLTAALFAYALAPVAAADVKSRCFRYAGVTPASGGGFDLSARLAGLAPALERYLPGGYLVRVRARLRMAGMFAVTQFQVFLVVQALAATAAALPGLMLGGANAMPLALAGAIAGALVPSAWLSARVRARQAAINAVLPDTLDMLTACVEAGLGLDAAIGQLVRRRSHACWAINQELGRYLQELQMGVSRTEALRNLSTRSGIEDLRGVVGALLQGDALGVSVAQVLRAQAEHLRMRRKQRAEEKAMKAPIKIIFPLVFGIFPAIFVLLLGPAMLRLFDSLGGH